MQKILIAGGSGFVGRQLTSALQLQGHEVAWLTRNASLNAPVTCFTWDIEHGVMDAKAFEFADIIINLAGAGVADKKWTEAYKKELFSSRIDATNLLAEYLKQYKHKVVHYIGASAIGIYGNQTGLETPETALPTQNYLAQLCVDWEAAHHHIKQLGISTSIVRVGVVLGNGGGFVKQVSALIQLYLGAALGSGEQYTSWIHIDDLCAIFSWLIEHPQQAGVYNGVSPHPVSNARLTKLLAKVLNKPILLPPAPAFVLKLLYGEMAGMLLASQHISAQKLRSNGFVFRFEQAEDALKNLVQKQ